MVIPIYDSDPLEKSRRAYVNWALIAVCTVVFLIQQGEPDNAAALMLINFGLTPNELVGGISASGAFPSWASPVTYMFLHGGWLHLFFNMLFLFTLGDNIEDALGHGRYLVFYLLSGIGAGLVHTLAAPSSNVPLVGASGAIAGVVAAYLMLRPCAKIVVLAFGIIPLRLGSAWVLGFWILVQVWNILSNDGSDVAWWAHIGGLATGAILIIVMRPAGVPLFECMRPGDVIVASAARPSDSASGGPWGSR